MVMNKFLHISANLDQPVLLENMVEKLAQRHYDTGYAKAEVPKNQQAIDTSSTQTYVSGTVAIEENNELINMPFITCFLFTCVKEKNGEYKLAWSSSLS